MGRIPRLVVDIVPQEQVGAAVQSLDEGTQRNSAMVEESAAAAQALREQADRMARAVAVFRLQPA